MNICKGIYVRGIAFAYFSFVYSVISVQAHKPIFNGLLKFITIHKPRMKST